MMKTTIITIPATSSRRWTTRLRHLLRCGLRDEQGQSFVELALTLPVLTVILLGAAEFGRLAYAAIEVSNAARSGVAYGAQTLSTAADTTGMQTAATNDGSDISSWASVGLSATAFQTCKCSDGSATTCATALTTCVSPAHVLLYVQVNTQATVDPLFYVYGLPRSYALKGQAIMRVSQQ
jgi:Flp pilus assembly protein TadG